MKRNDVIFDTSIVIAYNLPDPGKWLSAVVLEELVAGVVNKDEIQTWRAMMIVRLKGGDCSSPITKTGFKPGVS